MVVRSCHFSGKSGVELGLRPDFWRLPFLQIEGSDKPPEEWRTEVGSSEQLMYILGVIKKPLATNQPKHKKGGVSPCFVED